MNLHQFPWPMGGIGATRRNRGGAAGDPFLLCGIEFPRARMAQPPPIPFYALSGSPPQKRLSRWTRSGPTSRDLKALTANDIALASAAQKHFCTYEIRFLDVCVLSSVTGLATVKRNGRRFAPPGWAAKHPPVSLYRQIAAQRQSSPNTLLLDRQLTSRQGGSVGQDPKR